jgi:hypothetical protein
MHDKLLREIAIDSLIEERGLLRLPWGFRRKR